jgi:uncharacterized protein
MRGWLAIVATLGMCALGAGTASAQSPVSCEVAPQSVCGDQELVALEGERATLVQQLTAADPQNAALKGEQTWIDGLSACGEDAECYRTAYRNHNQALPDAAAAAPVASDGTSPFEAPADAPTVDEQIAIDELQAERLREAAEEARNNTPPRQGDAVYVPAGLPGWGFFTAIGVTLLIWFWLTGAMKRNRQTLRAEQARLRAWQR